MMAIEQAELNAAESERSRIIAQSLKYRARAPEPRYETWCYCSWCRWSALSTPHYRRQACPSPDEYASHGRPA